MTVQDVNRYLTQQHGVDMKHQRLCAENKVMETRQECSIDTVYSLCGRNAHATYIDVQVDQPDRKSELTTTPAFLLDNDSEDGILKWTGTASTETIAQLKCRVQQRTLLGHDEQRMSCRDPYARHTASLSSLSLLSSSEETPAWINDIPNTWTLEDLRDALDERRMEASTTSSLMSPLILNVHIRDSASLHHTLDMWTSAYPIRYIFFFLTCFFLFFFLLFSCVFLYGFVWWWLLLFFMFFFFLFV